MKKTVKIISTILLAMMLVTTIAGTVLAKTDIPGVITEVENADGGDNGKISKLGGNIVNILQVVGIVVAVIVILVIGIKYLIGSAEEKAEYKKTMIPYVIGALLVFAGTSIVKVVYSVVSNAGAGLE